MSRNFNFSSNFLNQFSQERAHKLDYENCRLVEDSTTFIVPNGTKVIKFTAVGGGQAGVGTTGGAGAGYFEKTFFAPFVGLTTSFILTIGSANGGNTILKYSDGTTIATAYGATGISPSNPVGIGGSAEGGDFNANGSPGGSVPGVGGASGSIMGNGVYDPISAGHWPGFSDSLTGYALSFYRYFKANYSSDSSGIGTFIDYREPTIFYNVSPAGGAGQAGGSTGPTAHFIGKSGYGGPGGPRSPSPSGGAGGPGGPIHAAGIYASLKYKSGDGGAAADNTSTSQTNQNGATGSVGGSAGQIKHDYGSFGGAGGSSGDGKRGGKGGNAGGQPTGSGGNGGVGGPGGRGWPGGPGGFGGGGGRGGNGGPGGPGGRPAFTATATTGGSGGLAGNGGPGGYGGGGGGQGVGANGGPSNGAPSSPGTVGQGGPGAIIIEWSTTSKN